MRICLFGIGLCVLWLTLAVFPASAANPTCSALSRLPESPSEEAITWARGLAQAILDAEARFSPTPKTPKLSFVAHGPALSPGAWYCPSDDTIFVSRELALWSWQGRASDGADFLGFVIAHELAHRRFDDHGTAVSGLAISHSTAHGQDCPANGDIGAEVRADHRAAFLLGLARNPYEKRAFSPFNLNRRDGLRAFLAQELGWRPNCPALDARVKAVESATSRMKELGDMYDTATLLALAPYDGPRGARGLALRAFERIAKVTSGPGWDALPEVDLLRAVMHLDRAQRFGWCPAHLKAAAMSPDPCALKCAPRFPKFAGLSPYDLVGTRDGDLTTRAEQLAHARALVERAKKAGLAPGHADGVEVCLAFAEAAPERGLSILKHQSQPALWVEVKRLLEFQRQLLESSDPVLDLAGAGFDPLPQRLRVPDAPIAGGPMAAAPRPGACEGAWTSYALGEGWTLEIANGCRRLSAGARGIAFVEQSFAGSLEPWRLSCDIYGPGVMDDGSIVYGARCGAVDVGPEDGWILFERGSKLERVVRMKNF